MSKDLEKEKLELRERIESVALTILKHLGSMEKCSCCFYMVKDLEHLLPILKNKFDFGKVFGLN